MKNVVLVVLSGSVALVEMDCMNCPIRPFLEKFSKLKANRFGWDDTQINRNVGGIGDFILFVLYLLPSNHKCSFEWIPFKYLNNF